MPELQPITSELGSETGSSPRPQLLLYESPAPPGSRAAPTDRSVEAVDSPGPPTVVIPATAVSETVAVQTGSGGRPAPSAGSRFHVVQPGESLWSIAERLLGPGATASEIAAEVERLWELNRDRIASGDADVITVGTQLRLR